MANSMIPKSYNSGTTASVYTTTPYDGQYYVDKAIQHGLGKVPSSIVVTVQSEGGSSPSNSPNGVEIIGSNTSDSMFVVRIWSRTNNREFKINWAAFK